MASEIDNTSSFGSTTSSSSSSIISNNSTTTNYLLSDFININTQQINPSFSVPHPYYNCIATLKTPNHHHITCLAIHNNLLYAATGNQITTFDLTTLSPIPSFDGQDLSSGGFIKSIVFVDDHKILTAHQDGKIRAWKDQQPQGPQHRLITALPTMKDKMRRFIRRSNYVKVRRNKTKLWIEHNDAVSGLAVNVNDGVSVIYSVSWDKTLKVWRGSDFKCLESITAHEDAVNAVTVSGDGTVYTGSADGTIKVWKNKNDNNNNNNSNNDKVWRHSMVSTMEKHRSTVNALALSSDGKVLLSGGCDGMIIAWEKDDDDDDRMVENGVVGGHDGAVLALIRLDDDHDLFVSGGADRTVRIWGRVGKGYGGGGGGDGEKRGLLFCCMGVLEGHDKPVRSLAVVPPRSEGGSDGVVRVCSGSLDGEIRVWEIMVSELIINHRPSCNKDY